MQTARITGPVTPTRATVGGEDIIIIGVIVITAAICTDAEEPRAGVVCDGPERSAAPVAQEGRAGAWDRRKDGPLQAHARILRRPGGVCGSGDSGLTDHSAVAAE
jgi:hypothetical protein